METDAEQLTHPEAGDQSGSPASVSPDEKTGSAPSPAAKTGGTTSPHAGSGSKQKHVSKQPDETALREARHEAAAAQAALEDVQRRLATVEEALAEEREKAAAAQRALAQQTAATRGQDSELHVEPQPGEDAAFGVLPFVGFRGTDIVDVSRQMFEQAVRQPPLALKHSTNFLLDMGRVVTGQSTIEPDAKDKRFLDEAWKTNPFYDLSLQTYLTWEKSLNAFIDDAGLDKKDADRARFVLSLFAEAVAPTNTLLGNPAAMKKLYETGGASLVRGLTHMLEDLANNGGLPSQVDMKAFQVGKDLALSPGAVVFHNEVLELIQYQPTTPQVYRRPLLIVPPQVNKFYVIDLSPSKSMIRYLVANGMQVFAISWRNPTPKQREWGFETYDQIILEAIEAIRSITKSPDTNVIGSCLGGMTLAILLGHLNSLIATDKNASVYSWLRWGAHSGSPPHCLYDETIQEQLDQLS